MLTYRTGSAGSGRGARNMAEHLLQQTLTPEMAVMADYYEQGVAPPTAATAAASRYFRHTVDGQLRPGAALDELVNTEAARLGESALGHDGRAIEGDELHLRALAAFTAAGMIPYDEALASLARLTGEMPAERMDAAIQAAITERDHSSATATPRRDMNPALANRLGIDPNRGLTAKEVAFLLNGQRADGKDIEGKEKQSATLSLGELFGLDAASRPTRPELERVLAGQTADGEPLAKDQAGRAVIRFIAAMGAKSKDLSPVERENILSGRKTDGSELSDREYRAGIEASKSRIGYIDLTFSAPKSLSVAWALAPTQAERAMLHQAHTDAVHSTLLAIETEIGRARLGHGGKNGFEPGSIGYVTFDHYSARPTVEVIREDEHGRPMTELHTLTGTKGRVPGDMQIHTHAAVMNAVETQSGRVGGLDLAQLEGRIHEWGALYHAYLAKNVRKHGVEVALDHRTEMSRLAAVPESVVAQFSKRTLGGTEAARAYAQSQGVDWDSLSPERKIFLLKSGVQDPRGAKSDDVSDIAAWRKMAETIGYEHRSVLRPDAIQAELSREERLETAYRAALPLLEKHFDRRAVIDGADARVTAAKGLIIAGIESPEDVSTITRAFRERGINRRGENAALVWGSVAGTQGKEKISITTTLEEREETILIATARAGGRDKSAALPPAKIETAVRAFPDLNFKNEHGQAQRAIIDKLGTGGRIGLAIGVAGSGKSTLLKPLVRAWQEEGRVVYGMALAWRQSDDLAEAGIGKGNIRAVASFLKGIEAKTIQLTRNSVVVVDEVGLLGTRQLNDILAVQKEKKFQLVMIGDPKQMQAVEAGPVIDLLRRALGAENVPELGGSVRQKGAEERETTLMFRNGQTAEALDRKAANDTLHIAPGGYREAIAHVATLWQQRRDEHRGRPDFTITVSAPTNTEAHDISVAIRERRRTIGQIGADKITVQATDGEGVRSYNLPLAEGDRVRLFARTNAKFTETDTVGNIGRNGTVLEITAIHEDGLMMRNPSGKMGFVAWTTLKGETSGQVRLAYGEALTTNTAQGSTVTEHIHAMPSGSRLVSAFGAYTSGSRHREQSFIVTSEGAERSEIAGRRPLGDRREVSLGDVLDNMKRNLARQPEKGSSVDFVARAANVRRGTIQSVQQSHQKIQARVVAQEAPTSLPERFANRRLTRALESRLPGLSAQLRRYGETVAHIARSGTALAERIAAMARRQTKRQTVEQYWESVAAKGASQPEQDQAQNLSKHQGLAH
ncbi:MAG: relaxase domain-containing protein [Acidocella sp.]|nr:relaxase domain-containing protein [Acidocella sp.]